VKPGVAVRVAAADSVGRITDDGAYSNVILRAGGESLDRRNRKSFEHLVRVTIRYLLPIDRALDAALNRPLDDLDPAVRAVLRVGTAELIVDRTEPYAVVDTAVEAARAAGAGRAAGFINGVLRTVARTIDRAGAGQGFDPSRDFGIPRWMYRRVAAALTGEAAAEFFSASNVASGIGVRYRNEPLAEGSLGISGAAYLDADLAVELKQQGIVDLIDPASTAVGLALAPRSGHRVLDLAAAPGGKTAHLWDLMSGTGHLVAADRSERRLSSARRRLVAMGVEAHYVVMDGRVPALQPASFDRVLLDAPCTGLGTLRRRPEIRQRLDPDSPHRLASVQGNLLDEALSLVAAGGRLVYSVCTVFAEETIEIVAERNARPPADLPGDVWGKGRLLAPHTSGTDGMFIAVIDV
jgi:16S rRNA (cytosine967-C5)-methyltransferase